MLRVDSFATNKQPEKVVVSVEGVRGLLTVPNAPFACVKSIEIQVSNSSDPGNSKVKKLSSE